MSDVFKKNGIECKRGDYLFYDGDKGEEMYIILEGSVDILKGKKNNEKVIATIEKGDFFGEMAILTSSVRSASARIASKSAKVLVINKATFKTMIKSNVEIALKILERLSNRISHSNIVIQNLLLKNTETRVVHYLKETAKNTKVLGGEIFLNISENQIASSIYIKKEEVKKVLDKLKKTSFFDQLTDSKFVIKNLDEFNEFYDYLYKKEKYTSIFG